jgi:hypothetical protein
METITYPLDSITLDEAKNLQFRIVDTITQHFSGAEIMSLGDLGLVPGLNKPSYTKKAEAVLAQVFQAESALFVRGAGTGALRWALASALSAGDCLLVHRAPIYPTTKVTVEMMGLRILMADFNNIDELSEVCAKHKSEIKCALIQHTRQKIDDSYNFCQIVSLLKELLPDTPLITDDNYAALKVSKIGCQAGADIATFSCFKTLGPEGVGVLLGSSKYIEKAEKFQYSGGSQVQGHEAMAVLRGLIYAPVALSIQSEVGNELVKRLNSGELPGVRRAFIANAQSKVLLVEFEQEIAEAILKITPQLGAAPQPVGCESIYEFVPMIYRVSGTFREVDPTLERRMIRINPLRSGADTIIRMLRTALEMI